MEYKNGKYYEGLGKYIGIIRTYPYGENYILVNHKFVMDQVDNSPSKVNEVLIEKIER